MERLVTMLDYSSEDSLEMMYGEDKCYVNQDHSLLIIALKPICIS